MTRTRLLLILSSLLFGASCGSDVGDPNCDGDNCDNDPGAEDGADKPCAQLIADFSGTDLSGEKILGLDDGISKLVLNGVDSDGKLLERCPMSVPDIIEQLTDSGCSSIGTQMVSERSQALGFFTDYRAVVDMDCPQGKVFLHFPIHAKDVKDIVVGEDGSVSLGALNATKMHAKLKRTFPAIIAQDSSGVFNFYQSKNQRKKTEKRFCSASGTPVPENALECEKSSDCIDEEFPNCVEGPEAKTFISDFRYFGSSMDYLSQEKRHATIAKMRDILPIAGTSEVDVDHTLEINANCAGCHPNGGILIREFDSPWVHWEHFIDSPEYEELIDLPTTDDGLAFLGRRKDGASLEGTVRNLNDKWNDTRITKVFKILGEESEGNRTLTTGDLLRPLLCTDEFMIGNSGSTSGRDITSVKLGTAVLDPAFGRSSITVQNWEAEIAEAGWFLAGFWNTTLHDILRAVSGGLFRTDLPRDTLVGGTFMQRADIDLDYQEKLIESGVVNQKLVNALLAVDFTQGIFSDERCSLVDVVNNIDPGVYMRNAGSPRTDGANLLNTAIRGELTSSATGFKGDLFDALAPSAEVIDLRSMGSDFADACESRPVEEFTTNYVRYMTNVRHRAAGLSGSPIVDSSFLLWRFPGSNGFLMSQALHEKTEKDANGVDRTSLDTTQGFSGLKGLEPGLRFSPDCTMP